MIPIMLLPHSFYATEHISLKSVLKLCSFFFLGVYCGPAENSVVFSVPLFTALQVPHIPHV